MHRNAPPEQSEEGAEILSWLAGTWLLDRRIARYDGDASMRGHASFTSREGSGRWLDYRELGRLRLPAGEFEAERSYVFRPAPLGFAVYFSGEPARLFHRITLTAGSGELVGGAKHRCGSDLYDNAYAFRADGTFVVRHDVQGPRKGYQIESFYKRMPADGRLTSSSSP